MKEFTSRVLYASAIGAVYSAVGAAVIYVCVSIGFAVITVVGTVVYAIFG